MTVKDRTDNKITVVRTLKLPLLLTPLTGTPDRYIHVGNSCPLRDVAPPREEGVSPSPSGRRQG
jgi:hypothetical protein